MIKSIREEKHFARADASRRAIYTVILDDGSLIDYHDIREARRKMWDNPPASIHYNLAAITQHGRQFAMGKA